MIFVFSVSLEKALATTPAAPKATKETVAKKTIDEIAPKLEKLSQSIYTGEFSANGRPSRVSERLIYQKLHLSAHRLEKMPKCRAFLEHFSESYEENWARRIVWAYQKLKSERPSGPVFWSDIRDLSGVKKHNIEKVLPFLQKHADTNTCNAIIQIIQYNTKINKYQTNIKCF